MDDIGSLDARAKVHAALGDPARLAIVDMLSLGDASPGEIGRTLTMPTNLVAHHLKVLNDAGLISRTTSEGDRRRTYLHLVPEIVTALMPAPVAVTAGRVLFVCTRNSARSQLAAALWTQHSTVPARSAGTQPADRVHPRAVRIAARHGLTINPTATAAIDDVLHDDDLIVAVCDNAHEHLTTSQRSLHWSVPDPVPADTDDAFETAYATIANRVNRLVPLLAAPRPA